MRVFLFGVSGQIGRQLAPYFRLRADTVLYDPIHGVINLANTQDLFSQVCFRKPDLIINAAAYTNVDSAEYNEELANKINHLAVKELAHAAKSLDVPLIHYSTDYVFDGKSTDKYLETSTPNPLSVYGKTKLAGDEAILAVAPRGVIFRTSWVYSNHRTNFYKTMQGKICPGASLRVVDDQFGTPNSASVLAHATYKYMLRNTFDKAEIVNLVCDEYASWYQFAKLICAYWGLEKYVEITPITTAQYLAEQANDRVIAPRPMHAVLDNRKAKSRGVVLPTWVTELRKFMGDNR